MHTTAVGVFRGGTSNEYDISLKTGAAVMQALPEDRYRVCDILVDKQGAWHVRGLPTNPMRALSQIDVVFNAVHGGVGEDGTLARIWEQAHMPYTGSRPAASLLSLNKIRANAVLKNAGIPVARAAGCMVHPGEHIDVYRAAREIFSQFGPPYVVKPHTDGASHGILVAPTFSELPDALAQIIAQYGAVLVEEMLYGEEVVVGVIEGFRDMSLYALPAAHVIKPAGKRIVEPAFYRNGSLRFDVPAQTFQYDARKQIQDLSRQAHETLGLSHHSTVEFIVTKHGPYLIEVNSIPMLHEYAPLPAMLESVGSSTRELAEHVLALART
ncbi:MAG: ATP-grasp domain-containing protein [Patescibacteria group bacterium]